MIARAPICTHDERFLEMLPQIRDQTRHAFRNEPLLLIATGRERALQSFNERAQKDFKEAVTIRPNDAEVWACRGRSSLSLDGTRKRRPTWPRLRIWPKVHNSSSTSPACIPSPLAPRLPRSLNRRPAACQRFAKHGSCKRWLA